MEHEEHLRALAADVALLVAAVERAGPDAAVPGCPGWTVRDLTDHVSEVYRHKTACIRLGVEPEPWPPVRDLADPVGELRAAYDELVAELSAHAPTDPAPTWDESDQTVGFWSRRMAQETAVHRVDAELAAGDVQPVAADLAADGVDEVLVVFAAGDWSDLPQPGPGVVVVLTAVDAPSGERSWTVHALPDALRVDAGAPEGAGADEADVVVRGAAEDLLLWLWGRRDRAGLTVEGDAAAADRLVERLRLVTG